MRSPQSRNRRVCEHCCWVSWAAADYACAGSGESKLHVRFSLLLATQKSLRVSPSIFDLCAI